MITKLSVAVVMTIGLSVTLAMDSVAVEPGARRSLNGRSELVPDSGLKASEATAGNLFGESSPGRLSFSASAAEGKDVPDPTAADSSTIRRQTMSTSADVRQAAPLTGRVLFQDDFSGANGVWDVGEDELSKVGYVNGEYLVQVKQQPIFIAQGPPIAVDDFGLQVEARAASTTSIAMAGLRFGYNPNGSTVTHSYFFVSPKLGEYRVLQFVDSQLTTLVPATASAAIRRGAEKNVLRVERRGNEVRFIINGTTVDSMTIAHQGADQVGIGTLFPTGTGTGDALYDNFLLETLDDTASTAVPTSAGPTPSGTRLPVATPSAVPTGYSEVVLKDDFSDPGSGWRIYHDGEFTAEYQNGEYYLDYDRAGYNWPVWHPTELREFDFQVDARVERQDASAAFGIVFGKTDRPSDPFYYLAVSPGAGRFALIRFTDVLNVEIPATASTAIKFGTAVNRLRLVSDGTKVSFFVNGVAVFSYGLQVARGHVGLGISTGATADGVGSYFDNLLLTAPAGSFAKAPDVPSFSRVVLQDDFSDPTSGWNVGQTTDYLSEYANGRYHVVNYKRGSGRYFDRAGGRYRMDYSIDVLPKDPVEGTEYGIAVRGISTGFALWIDPVRGTYMLVDSTVANFPLIYPSESPAIRRGANINRLRIISLDEHIIVLVNDVKLATVHRQLLTRWIGVGVRNIDRTDGAEVYFDNARVLTDEEDLPTVQPERTSVPDPETLYLDDFSDPNSGWPRLFNQRYSDGEYQVTLGTGSNGLVQSVPDLWVDQWADLHAYEVATTVRIDQAPQATGRFAAGLAFGFDKESDYVMGFLFGVDPARRQFAVHGLFDGILSALPIIKWTSSQAIQPTGKANHLRVARGLGEDVSLYCNDVLLITLDLPYPLGLAGLWAIPFDTREGHVVAFDDFEVRRYGRGATSRGGARTPTPLHDRAAQPRVTSSPGAGTRAAVYLPSVWRSAHLGIVDPATPETQPTRVATPAPLPGSGDATLRASFSNPNALTSVDLNLGAGEVWVGSDGGGLLRWDVKTGTHTRFTAPRDLPDDRVLALARGEDGALWIGTGDGAALLPPNGTTFLRVERSPGERLTGPVRAIHITPDGTVWLAVGGLGVLKRSGEGAWQLLADGAPDAVKQATSLAVDRVGDLWVGSAGIGVARLGAGGNWQTYRADPATVFQWDGGELLAGTREMLNTPRLAPLGRIETSVFWVGEGCRDYDPPTAVAGKVALFSVTGTCARLDAIFSVLAARGAVAALVVDGTEAFEPSRYLLKAGVNLPGVWVPNREGKLLADRLKAGGVVRVTLPERLPTDNIGAVAVDPAGRRWIGSRAAGSGQAGAMNGGTVVVAADGRDWRILSRWRQMERSDLDPILATGVYAEPKDQVYSVVFSESGETWLGSDGGLDRLDVSLRSIGTTSSGNSGLADDRVRSLAVTADNELWAATANGLGHLSVGDGLWSTLKADANLSTNWLQASAVDRYGDLWVGGGFDPLRSGDHLDKAGPASEARGLSRLNRATGNWSQPLAGAITSLHADPLRDILWLGDAESSLRLDTMSGRLSHEPEQPDIWAQFKSGHPVRMPAWELWLTRSAGRLDAELALWGDLCSRSTPLQDVRGRIALIPMDTKACSYPPLLTAVQRQGAVAIVIFQTTGQEIALLPDLRNPQLAIPGLYVSNNVGFHLQAALEKGEKVSLSLRSAPWRPLGVPNANDRLDMASDSNGNLWVGGVDSLDRRTPDAEWTNFHTRNSGLDLIGQNNPGVRAVAVDASNNKWLGTERAGAIRLGADDQTWTPFSPQSTGGAIPDNPITDIAMDSKDNVWFATAGAGVRRLATDRRTWTSYTRDTTSDGLPSDQVAEVKPGPDGAMWFGTRSGLARLAPDLKTWSTIPTAASVTTLVFDQLGDLWFGTAGLGLTQLSRREPGADCASALPLSPGAVVDTALDNQSDIDLYAVKVDKPFSRIELTVPDPERQLDLALRRSCIGIGSQGRHIGSQGRHIGSQGRHIGSEQRLVFDVLAETGTYFVEVRPRIGAQNKPMPYRLRSGLTPVDLDSRRTLVLTDLSAVRTAFAIAADSEEYLAWLEALGSLQADNAVGALVITDLKTETNPAVRDAYTAWLTNQDAGETNSLANELALALRDWIWQRKASDMPRLQYVVLAGDDRILPHFRLAVDKPREGTGWHPESEYLATAGLDPDSTIAAALKDDLILTDDLYGAPPPAPSAGGTSAVAKSAGGSSGLAEDAKRTGDAQAVVSPAAKDLPIPQLAVGRLVERPSAMTKAIDGFLARRGVTTLTSSLVAASGAFEDAARVGAYALAESGLAASKRAELLGSGWTQLDLQRTLLAEKRDLFFGAVPGDHASLALPDGRRLEPDTLRASASPLVGTLAVMLASHSGLNAPGPNHPRKLDWPEAWLAQGASLVAPTGYAYGLDGEAHYGEKLAADFVRLAVQGDGRVIGDALVVAKQDYLADAAEIGPFDAAAMAGFILYGLPMARIEVTTPPTAVGGGLLGASWGPDATAAADVADGRAAGAPVEVAAGTWRVTVTQAVSGLEKKDGPAGSYYTVPGVQPRLVAGAPVQPQLRVDVPELQVAGSRSGGSAGVGAPSTAAAGAALPLRGLLWTGGKSRQVSGFTPWWLGALASSLGAAAGQPASSGQWQPTVPVSLRGWRASEGAGDLLVAGQSGRLFYTAGQLEGGGALRLFDELASEEFYSAAEDVTAPQIKDVEITDRGGELEVSAKVEDAGGVLKAVAVWTRPGTSEWRAVELTADGGGTWRGRMPAGASAVVEAVDRAGNVQMDDNGGWLW